MPWKVKTSVVPIMVDVLRTVSEGLNVYLNGTLLDLRFLAFSFNDLSIYFGLC